MRLAPASLIPRAMAQSKHHGLALTIKNESQDSSPATLSHPIQTPARTELPATVVILLNTALLAILPFAAPHHLLAVTIVSAALFLVAVTTTETHAIHVALFALLVNVWAWPFFLIVPLLAYAMISKAAKRRLHALNWLKPGKMNGSVVSFVILVALVSGLALWLWFEIFHPDVEQWLNAIPAWRPELLALGGLGFALLNAALEESIYRGLLMQCLDAALGAGVLVVFIQAIAFGLLHIHGVPSGWIGVGLSFIYGLMLGFIRRYSAGMLAPFLAHVMADIVIFTMLAFRVGALA